MYREFVNMAYQFVIRCMDARIENPAAHHINFFDCSLIYCHFLANHMG